MNNLKLKHSNKAVNNNWNIELNGTRIASKSSTGETYISYGGQVVPEVTAVLNKLLHDNRKKQRVSTSEGRCYMTDRDGIKIEIHPRKWHRV